MKFSIKKLKGIYSRLLEHTIELWKKLYNRIGQDSIFIFTKRSHGIKVSRKCKDQDHFSNIPAPDFLCPCISTYALFKTFENGNVKT